MKNMLLTLIGIIYVSFLFSEENISFFSANPFSFNDIIENLENQKIQEVSGILRFPDNTSNNKKFPLVIGVAGSVGWGEHHQEYLKMYRDMGIATFELNSFKSRGVESTVGTQTEVTTAMMILDVYRAFEVLANHPNIDKDRVALTGWSLGGGVTLFSGWKPLKEAIGIDLKFSARLAFYPACFVSNPVHIILMGVTMHYTQYLYLTNHVHQSRTEIINQNEKYKKKGIYNFFIIIIIYSLIMTFFSTMGKSDDNFYKELIIIPILGQMLHFYIDSQVWKFSEKHNRENVLQHLSKIIY